MSSYPKIHLSFPVRNLDRSVAFYKQFFGEDPVKVLPDYVKFLPAVAPLNLALYPGDTSPADGRNHYGIEVRDLQAVMAHLHRIRASGLSVREEMDVDCCHANQDKFWVEDPDGREWEIYVLNRDLDQPGTRREDGCCAAPEAGEDAGQAKSPETQACCAAPEAGEDDGQAKSPETRACCG